MARYKLLKAFARKEMYPLFWKKTKGAQPLGVTLGSYAAVYAIGDVHGCLNKLKALEKQIELDAVSIPGEKAIVNLGDYIDRGHSSSGVLSYLQSPTATGFSRVVLTGNHEQMMLDALQSGNVEAWFANGGVETVRSYGVSPEQLLEMGRTTRKQVLGALIREEDVEFLKALPCFAAWENFLFVHAGVRPGLAIEKQTKRDLLWIREPFLSEGPGLPLTVIHGHTPGELVQNEARRIGIDTGAFAGGKLTAVRVMPDGSRVFFEA